MVAATGINRTAGEGYRAALSGKDGLMNRKEISEKLLTFSAEEIHTREDKNKISKIKRICRFIYP